MYYDALGVLTPRDGGSIRNIVDVIVKVYLTAHKHLDK
jgi:hypothetical protein